MVLGGIKIVIALTYLLFSTNTLAQFEINCANGNCSYPSNLSVNDLNLVEHTRFEANAVTDALSITAPPANDPRDFRAWLRTRTTNGQNLTLNINSQKKNAKAGSGVVIVDAVRNLSINTNGYSGVNHPSATQICATKIRAGDYGLPMRTAFNARRTADPMLNPNECDVNDLYNIQNNGQIQCDAGYVEIPTQNISGTRWEKKRECTTQAGRSLCVARRINLRCDIYADKPTGGGGACCDTIPSPTVAPTWRCEILRCEANDSGWHQRFTFRLWEEEYQDMVRNGHSDTFICQTLTGAGGIGDTLDSVDKTYVPAVSYQDISTDLTIYPPIGSTVNAMQFSAGVCGSFNEDPAHPLDSFSQYFNSGTDFVRMSGEGLRKDCVGIATDYPAGSYCRDAIEASTDPLACTGSYDDYSEGNKCWEELRPDCSLDQRYEQYEVGSWCYNKHVNTCLSRAYSIYPADSMCHIVLKENQCGGNATDYQAGHRCWTQLNSDTCTGSYTSYTANSYCYNKLAPECTDFDVPVGTPTLSDPDDPDSPLIPWEHPLKNHPDYNFCMAGTNIEKFPNTCPVGGDYTTFPKGSKCWTDLQPTCPLPFESYTAGSYCYEKTKPICSGSHLDYPVGSYCYDKMLPETTCPAEFTDSPDGSYCYEKNIPVCSGVYTDYLFHSYCYLKLEPLCTGVYTDYPLGSDCRRKLAPINEANEVSSCEGAWSDWPAGSYCWKELQPKCEDPSYTAYPAGSYCYNRLYPGQSLSQASAINCSIITGAGSMCWEQGFPACVDEGPVDDDETVDTELVNQPGQYCWYKTRAEENGFCDANYEEYPRGSSCWTKNRGDVKLFYKSPENCAVRCNWNGTYTSCELGNPQANLPHAEVMSQYVGQQASLDALLSFKIRYKLLSELGMEYNHDTEVKIRVKNPSLP